MAAAGTSEVQLQFFPEGGNLVQGLTSTVGFRAFRADQGTGVSVSGRIVDSAGNTLGQIHSLHDGLGSFVLHPMANNHYRAILDFSGGIHKSFALPDALESGVVLFTRHVLAQTGQDSVYYRISRSVISKNAYQHLLLCAQMDGICSFTYINFDTVTAGNYNNTIQSATTPLALGDFPSAGVLQLTVFNEAGQPLAERMIFLQRLTGQTKAQLSPVQIDFSKRAKNTFILEVPGDDHGRYTVSVTQANPAQATGTGLDLRAYFLLHASINTPVTDLTWYLKDSSEQTLAALDLLLLTATWSKFAWAKILRDQFPSVRYYAQQSLVLRGRAFWVTKKNKVPMGGGEFSLILKSPKTGFFELIKVPVDSSGRFSVTDLNFQDTVSCYVEHSNERSAKMGTVELEKDPLDSVRFIFPRSPDHRPAEGHPAHVPAPNPPSVSADSMAQESYPLKQGDTAILKTINVKAYRKARTDSLLAIYATGIFARPDASMQILDLTDERSNQNLKAVSVLQYLESNVSGPVYKDDGSGEALIYWRMTADLFIQVSEAERIKANAPAFFLDEQKLNEGKDGYDEAIQTLHDVAMEQVALIRVFPPGTMPLVAGDAPHGAIAIYRKNGKEGTMASLSSRTDQITKIGYSTVPSFTIPNYEHTGSGMDPDHRSTLYWNSNLTTDSLTHRASFSYFTPDLPPESVRIRVEGTDRLGRLITLDQQFAR